MGGEKDVPVCELAAQWVKENMDNLPQSYNELLTTPAEYRSAIFSALTPEIKSQIWVEHLESFLQTNELSREQASLIKEAIDIASQPSTFEPFPEQNSELTATLSNIREQAKVLFGDKSVLIFASLYTNDLNSAEPSAFFPECACSTQSDWCWGQNRGCRDRAQCTDTEIGCGDFWLYPCDGMCVDLPIFP
jgi:hypothetical protein